MGISSRHFGRDSPSVAGQFLLESRPVRLALKSQAKARELQAWRACLSARAAPVLTTASLRQNLALKSNHLQGHCCSPETPGTAAKLQGKQRQILLHRPSMPFSLERGILAGKLGRILP